MTSYSGKHASYYDIFYADKPYEKEALFVHHCLQKCQVGSVERILELACGTGAHAFELEKLGYQIVATDFSEDMLVHARQKAEKLDSSIYFKWQDMRELKIPGEPFDAVICLFDSIGYVQTNSAIIKVLKGINHHLRENGLLIFEFWHAPAMLCSYEPIRIGRWKLPDGELLRISETRLEPLKQIASVKYTIFELRNDSTYSVLEETQKNRYFLVQEITNFLNACGFAPLKWYAGFDDEAEITESTWHIFAVVRKIVYQNK